MTNHNLLIHPLLKPYIKSIEIVDTVQSISPYTVYPDLCMVLGFQYQGHIELLSEKNKYVHLNSSGITGLLNNYRSFRAGDLTTKTILVRLYPWGVPLLFGESASAFTDQSYSLSDIIKEQKISILEEKIQTVSKPKLMINTIQEFLVQLYLINSKKFPPQPRIIHIAQKLALNPTIESIEELARNYGYSKRSLERYFQTAIGLSPKRFMLTARFNKVAKMLRAENAWENIAEHLNYYDQSHFIKEFKQFTGVTPQKFICISS